MISWKVEQVSFIQIFLQQRNWNECNFHAPCGWNVIAFNQILTEIFKKKQRCEERKVKFWIYRPQPVALANEGLLLRSPLLPTCKLNPWCFFRWLPGLGGWSPVATPDRPDLPTYLRSVVARCHVQRTVAGKPTTWSWLGVPRWCTCVFGKARGRKESMYRFPRFSKRYGFEGFLGLPRDLGKRDLGFWRVFFRWIPRIYSFGYKFELRDPMGTVSDRSGGFHRNLKEPPPNTRHPKK